MESVNLEINVRPIKVVYDKKNYLLPTVSGVISSTDRGS